MLIEPTSRSHLTLHLSSHFIESFFNSFTHLCGVFPLSTSFSTLLDRLTSTNFLCITLKMNEPIAIVGSSCRFPGGVSSPSKLWELLRDPKDLLVPFPPERLNLSSFYNKSGEHHGTTDVPNKSYLLTEDHRMFDASFFNINPMEADSMDPQQRLLLETVYEAFESAGYTISQMQETLTSVFVGVMTGDYYDIQLRDTETMARYHATGTARSILSNRISYFFNLTGPSMTIDTACSSSLVAVHQAVLSLRNGDSEFAVVAGSNMLLDPTM
jgi:aspyridone synthetase (hybrid polyketide synthase/nonribosomal peptide synthetase)